jgi:hypothetical protein
MFCWRYSVLSCVVVRMKKPTLDPVDYDTEEFAVFMKLITNSRDTFVVAT